MRDIQQRARLIGDGVRHAEQVTAAWRRGRVDAVVQSTDKNFMVPVGGAVVAAGRRRPGLVAAVNKVRGRC